MCGMLRFKDSKHIVTNSGENVSVQIESQFQIGLRLYSISINL